MRDFTYNIYNDLLNSLLENNYSIMPFIDYISGKSKSNKMAVLRHDVDKKPQNSLVTSKIENSLGIRASYYFRITNQSFNEPIIRNISNLNHEIGYHYEDLSIAKGDISQAIKSFENNLQKLRDICKIETICMHGSPLTKYDNRMVWKNYDYRSYGILGEPYFDIDYNEFFYITDTGRKWNSTKTSIRDSVNSVFKCDIDSTYKFIDNINKKRLPDKILINTHPQRWTNNYLYWSNEFLSQNLKNQIKKIIKYYKNAN